MIDLMFILANHVTGQLFSSGIGRLDINLNYLKKSFK
jgi:hypothetical protein